MYYANEETEVLGKLPRHEGDEAPWPDRWQRRLEAPHTDAPRR